MAEDSAPLASSEIPQWRTSTVISLCEQMRSASDFSAMPILADALQDENFPDEDQLTLFRSGSMSTIQAQRSVCLIMGGEYAEAVRKIEEIAADLDGPRWYGDAEDGTDDLEREPFDFWSLMDAAKDANEDDDSYVQMGNNERYRDVFPEEEFWRCFHLVTGDEVKDNRNNFFSCSC